MTTPLVTVAVPSFNQGKYIEAALASIFMQDVPVEVFVLDGGSTDGSLAVIEKWAPRLAGWRSHKDNGQGAAINEGIARGTAPFVCWLNSDDYFLPQGLSGLVSALEEQASAPAVYGRTLNYSQKIGTSRPVWVEAFDPRRLAIRCIISQPGTLIRRSAWEHVGGLDPTLHMVMDYDLWWRLYTSLGALAFLDQTVAVNRDHGETKTNTKRSEHYQEAIRIVRQHNGSVPAKWYLAWPYAVWFKAMINKLSI
jgi:glycosyltransferase involved in cell wall biosynthesis